MVLTAGLDDTDAALVGRVLTLLTETAPELISASARCSVFIARLEPQRPAALMPPTIDKTHRSHNDRRGLTPPVG